MFVESHDITGVQVQTSFSRRTLQRCPWNTTSPAQDFCYVLQRALGCLPSNTLPSDALPLQGQVWGGCLQFGDGWRCADTWNGEAPVDGGRLVVGLRVRLCLRGLFGWWRGLGRCRLDLWRLLGGRGSLCLWRLDLWAFHFVKLLWEFNCVSLHVNNTPNERQLVHTLFSLLALPWSSQ